MEYFISSHPDDPLIDFHTERIEIKEPLYCKDNTPCTKKAYLDFSGGEISIDDKIDKDFLCGVRLYNATAIVTGQELGNIPPIIATIEPVDVNNSTLELIDCTVKGITKAAIAAYGNLTVKNSTIEGNIRRDGLPGDALKEVTVLGSSIVGDIVSADNITIENSTVGGITNASTVTGKDSTINGAIINKYSKTVIELKNTSVTGYLSTTGDSDITLTADSGKDISIGDADLYHGIIASNSIEATYGTSNGTVSLKNITTSGNISFPDGVVSVTDSQIGGYIASFNELTARNSTIKESIFGSNTSTILLEGTTVEGCVNNYNLTTIRKYAGRRSKIASISDYGKKATIDNAFVGYIQAASEHNAVIIIKDSDFTPQSYSTAITSTRSGSTIIISDSRFSGYTSRAIKLEYDTTLTITGSTFTGNTTTTWRGGAILAKRGKISLSGCTFIHNQTLETIKRQTGGGAVSIDCNQDNVTTTIDGCTFRLNSSAGGYGHDIYMASNWDDGTSYTGCTLTVTNCTTDQSSNAIFINN